jgi:hypothetical protein
MIKQGGMSGAQKCPTPTVPCDTSRSHCMECLTNHSGVLMSVCVWQSKDPQYDAIPVLNAENKAQTMQLSNQQVKSQRRTICDVRHVV